MESKKRGRAPWSLVAVLGAGFMWACSGDAMHMMGDAAVDLGEVLRDASCAMAQDDAGGCEPEEPAHGSVVVVCDQEATWTTVEGDERTQRFSLVNVPTRNVQVESCPNTLPTCEGCTGTPPPVVTCTLTSPSFVGEQVYVRCGAGGGGTQRVVW